jgi:hypothetical protein
MLFMRNHLPASANRNGFAINACRCPVLAHAWRAGLQRHAYNACTVQLASQLDDFYHELIRMRGLEEAKLYFESQAAALDRTERIQATEEIGCDFHRLNGFLFAASEDHKLRQALTSGGFQMLILRVSGITNRAMMKHTAGTKIG